MEHQSGCLVCGAELVYTLTNRSVSCAYCGKQFSANVTCRNGHYICDSCHSLGAMDLIEQYAISTVETDPVQMAIVLMKNPAIKMHGPEHHFLVPAVLLAAYYNQVKDTAQKMRKIKVARQRAEAVKGGFCGFYGTCGAGVGTGIFISLVTDSTPLSTHGWKLSNQMTSQSLGVIANCGGPRCCKRDTFLALLTARRFVKGQFAVALPVKSPVRCDFSAFNKECLLESCPFYRRD